MKLLAKRIYLILLVNILFLVFYPSASLAQNQIPVLPPQGASTLTLEAILQKITNLLYYLVGSIAIIFLIIGGIQFIVAAGNPQGVQTAKSTIFYTLIGLVIVFLSGIIVQFLIKQLTS